MNEAIIEDLKQFIAATVYQEVSGVRGDVESLRGDMITMEKGIRSDMSKMEARLSGQISDLSQSVAEAIDSTNVVMDNGHNNHEQRIVKLEQKAA